MDNKTLLISGFLGLMLVIGVMQAWQLSSLSGKLSSVNAPSGANLQKSAGDDEYNKMMAEMHPDQVQNSKPSLPVSNKLPTGAAGLPAQVGGC